MLLFRTESLDPARNLAAEDRLLRAYEEPCCYLWRNDRTVVVGKNQNTVQEIDAAFVRSHEITVVRRLTGGGAVFHDKGNVNFSLMRRRSVNAEEDTFAAFSRPVVEFLKSLGAAASFSGRNDILVDGAKVSGTAQTVVGERTLHHGTLLFNADVSYMTGALRPSPEKMESKGIRSVRSRVTNLAPYLPNMAVEQFMDALYNWMVTRCGAIPTEFSSEDEAEIEHLAEEKYRTWEWTYGYSPAYSASRACRYSFGTVETHLNVKDGNLSEVRLTGDFFGDEDTKMLCEVLQGCPRRKEEILSRLSASPVPVGAVITGMTALQLAEQLAGEARESSE